MTIGRILASPRPEIITCEAGCTVAEAIDLLADHRIGALPIVERESVVGIFSERDVIYRMADEGTACLDRLVAQVMTAPPITVEKSAKVDEALGLMTRRRIRHLPVMDNGAFVGFVSIGDLVKYRIDKIESEAAALRDYIQSV